jgi:hypothetical protein
MAFPSFYSTLYTVLRISITHSVLGADGAMPIEKPLRSLLGAASSEGHGMFLWSFFEEWNMNLEPSCAMLAVSRRQMPEDLVQE